jgi:hypothetical protein
MVSTRRAASTTTRRATAGEPVGSLRERATATARRQRGAQQPPPKKKPDKRQEDVDATGNPTEPDVKHRDEGDRDAAQAVEIVSVEARLAVPMSARRVEPDR